MEMKEKGKKEKMYKMATKKPAKSVFSCRLMQSSHHSKSSFGVERIVRTFGVDNNVELTIF